ncbi:MAG: ATP-binding protein, partial [Proteobacteria bacterium]|nr:ATP-binding protein [Pseudomonadota bacterium]
MIAEQLRNIIKDGEGLTVEFKECRNQVNRDVYKSICAFLNRNGGHIKKSILLCMLCRKQSLLKGNSCFISPFLKALKFIGVLVKFLIETRTAT